jgi:hypothetical protein
MSRYFRTFVASRLVFAVLAVLPSPILPSAAWAAPTSQPVPSVDRVAFLPQSHLAEPLIATAPTAAAEDQALIVAPERARQRREVDDLSALTEFLAEHPHSGWRVALLLDLGLASKHYGYLSRAIDAWEAAWREGKMAEGPRGRALVDRAVGELILLHAELGHRGRVAALLAEIGDRPVTNPGQQWVQIARETLWVMQNDPKHLYLCGPMALRALMLAHAATPEQVRFLNRYRAGPKGVNLAEEAHLAEQARVPLVPVFRRPDQPVPLPSIVHWKIGHFAAILGRQDGRYQVKDPVLGRQDEWLTPAAIAAEGSGYFLAPADQVSWAGWRAVDAKEAGQVWGAGYTSETDPNDPGPPR